jgi:KUP system potassium uptake protein
MRALQHAPGMAPAQRSIGGSALLALGVVYGDIGTSPLYAAKETFNPDYGIPFTPKTFSVEYPQSSGFWSLSSR